MLEDYDRTYSSDVDLNLYSHLFSLYPDAVLIADRNGSIININHKAEEFLKYRPKNVVEAIKNLVHEQNVDEILTHFKQAIEGEEQDFTCEFSQHNGIPVHLRIRNLPINCNKQTIGCCIIAENLAEQDKIESELLKITNSSKLKMGHNKYTIL